MKQELAIIVGIGLALGFGRAGHADRVHLRNGGTMQGVVVKQDAARVVLRVGSKMTIELSASEIARVEHDSPDINAQTRSTWAAARQVEPSEPTEPEAVDWDPAFEFFLEDDAAPETKAPAEPPVQTPEQAQLQAALEDIDTMEGSVTPGQLLAQVGAPQAQTTGQTSLGQPYQDWAYDIGAGNVLVMRFRKTAGGFFATDRRIEEAQSNAPADATQRADAVPSSSATAES